MSYEKTIRALSGHFEGRAMSYEKTIRALSLHFEGTTKSYEKTIRALSLHFEGTTKSYEKTIRELSMHFEGRYVVCTPYLCNTGLILHWDYPNICSVEEALFPPCSNACAFFESITEQVILEDLLAMHSEIVRASEAGSDADVSEDMHYDESASGVQEGSNDMSKNVEGGIASGGRPQVEVQQLSSTKSTSARLIVESIGDCGMDVGPVKKKPDMDKQKEIQAIKAGLPNKTCLR
ncbi:hypothetical protein IFM89_038875 [Coptis chinensis]|uniref:Uncharacterized protein n=1 Tax=Coptis chinensis TaxID=261450 RepID=A0A835I479_9MAGN|nr:hypothetical protein IFM89_038875 [Coptis chinensis]